MTPFCLPRSQLDLSFVFTLIIDGLAEGPELFLARDLQFQSAAFLQFFSDFIMY